MWNWYIVTSTVGNHDCLENQHSNLRILSLVNELIWKAGVLTWSDLIKFVFQHFNQFPGYLMQNSVGVINSR